MLKWGFELQTWDIAMKIIQSKLSSREYTVVLMNNLPAQGQYNVTDQDGFNFPLGLDYILDRLLSGSWSLMSFSLEHLLQKTCRWKFVLYLFKIWILFKRSCPFYISGMSFSTCRDPSLKNVIIREDIPTSQFSWDGRSLTLADIFIQVMQLLPFVKMWESLLFLWVEKISKHRYPKITQPHLQKLTSPLFHWSWSQTEFWPLSPIQILLKTSSLHV